jgi:hypothetical protein
MHNEEEEKGQWRKRNNEEINRNAIRAIKRKAINREKKWKILHKGQHNKE